MSNAGNAPASTPGPGLNPTMTQAVREIIGNDPRVRRVVLFGSRAKGTHREGSDIDLAVFGEGLTQIHAAQWRDELEERLFPWSVDVVVVDSETHRPLLEHIDRVGIDL